MKPRKPFTQIYRALRKEMKGWKWCRDPQYGCFNCAMWYARTVLEHAADLEKDEKKK